MNPWRVVSNQPSLLILWPAPRPAGHSLFQSIHRAMGSRDPGLNMADVIIAGIPMENIAGTNTSVYAGVMFRDHHDSISRDPRTIPRYFMTGNATTMASNRISHFFDLRGPSMTVDTGCSTTLTALHLAFQSLRSGECDMSIVTGASLMLNSDIFLSMSNLGYVTSKYYFHHYIQ
jgi:acyl transferase domain-containing protein